MSERLIRRCTGGRQLQRCPSTRKLQRCASVDLSRVTATITGVVNCPCISAPQYLIKSLRYNAWFRDDCGAWADDWPTWTNALHWVSSYACGNSWIRINKYGQVNCGGTPSVDDEPIWFDVVAKRVTSSTGYIILIVHRYGGIDLSSMPEYDHNTAFLSRWNIAWPPAQTHTAINGRWELPDGSVSTIACYESVRLPSISGTNWGGVDMSTFTTGGTAQVVFGTPPPMQPASPVAAPRQETCNDCEHSNPTGACDIMFPRGCCLTTWQSWIASAGATCPRQRWRDD